MGSRLSHYENATALGSPSTPNVDMRTRSKRSPHSMKPRTSYFESYVQPQTPVRLREIRSVNAKRRMRVGGGLLGGFGATAIGVLLLTWAAPSEIRCGINWINGCILAVLATLAIAIVGIVLRAAGPLRGILGGWFFATLFGGAAAIITWINLLAPACPFISR